MTVLDRGVGPVEAAACLTSVVCVGASIMQAVKQSIPDVVALSPKIFHDERGFFSETYSERALAEVGIRAPFIQDNHSLSIHSGVVRGLHFQIAPHAQGKLVRVPRGAILDVAVDVRVGSPWYGKHVAVELSAENWTQLWIPLGFAHGFCTLMPNTEVVYKVTDYYAPECDRGLLWDDPVLGIAWPIDRSNAVLSAKDLRHPALADLPASFAWAGPR